MYYSIGTYVEFGGQGHPMKTKNTIAVALGSISSSIPDMFTKHGNFFDYRSDRDQRCKYHDANDWYDDTDKTSLLVL